MNYIQRQLAMSVSVVRSLQVNRVKVVWFLFSLSGLGAIMDNGLNYMDKENGMSGWQRLGVVLSVIIALLTIGTNFDSFPTQEKTLGELDSRVSLWATCDRYYEDIEAGRKNTDSHCSTYTKQFVIEKIKVELNWYQGQLNTLTERQVKFVAYYFAWWVGVSLIMYLIAITVKWVYRGFRPKRV